METTVIGQDGLDAFIAHRAKGVTIGAERLSPPGPW